MEKKDEDKSIMEEEEEEEEEEVKGRIPVIRIKIPPTQIVDDEEVKRHYCKSCDKSFSSGKALGGHMSSAHVQANKDYNSSSVKKMRKSYSGSEDNACNICGKLFHSKKSLFGHMRCHPERFWRGMEPPPPPQQEQEQEQDPNSELGRLKDWPSANKRGRGGGPVLSIMEKEKETTSMDESDTSDELYMNAINFLMGIKPAPSTTPTSSPDKYKCDLCNRIFLTHQALGGHRSSHNKFKMTIVNTNNRPSSDKKNKKEKKKDKDKDKDKEKGQSSSPAAPVFVIDLNQIPADEDDKEEMPDTPSNS